MTIVVYNGSLMVVNGSFVEEMTCNQRRLKHFWASLFILFSSLDLEKHEDLTVSKSRS